MEITIKELHTRLLTIEKLLSQTKGNDDLNKSEPIKIKIKENLKRHLFVRNMKPIELAKKSGVSKQTICDWQSGQVPKGIITLKKVADTLGITLDELIFGEFKC